MTNARSPLPPFRGIALAEGTSWPASDVLFEATSVSSRSSFVSPLKQQQQRLPFSVACAVWEQTATAQRELSPSAIAEMLSSLDTPHLKAERDAQPVQLGFTPASTTLRPKGLLFCARWRCS
eukprot:CAMPEP_0179436648 /NCGR_PEP_ID=MMETSP0799-20121207/20613_1 /TAXON_ID=46947 /ORGANISM="Geminigera cryophila, Strain CCMP2564" /LENGTH=121 /DNA_ID=CAMNT_0021216939 /DNA_START=1333 /DNA_END=1696 /DNA_ORIENTATION=+